MTGHAHLHPKASSCCCRWCFSWASGLQGQSHLLGHPWETPLQPTKPIPKQFWSLSSLSFFSLFNTKIFPPNCTVKESNQYWEKSLIPQMANSEWPQMAFGHLQFSCLIQRSRSYMNLHSISTKTRELRSDSRCIFCFLLFVYKHHEVRTGRGRWVITGCLNCWLHKLEFVHWALCNCQEEGKAGLSGGSTQIQSVITNQTPVWIHNAVSRRQTCSNLRFP